MAVTFSTVKAQNWMFGVTGAGNLNYLTGTTQRLDNSYFVPTAFHKGTGVKPFGGLLLEYNPGKIFGGMLNVGFDGRGAKFDDVIAPCNCPATLKTNLSYISIEPSLRINAGKSNFYFFVGPRVAFNLDKEYKYTQLKQENRTGDFSAINKTIFSGQAGAGYDYLISSAESKTAVILSPFISFHPYFGQDPRTIESMSLTTVRAGVSLKFGKARTSPALPDNNMAAVPNREVMFSVRAPKVIAQKRQVSETLPLLNYVFFDQGSTEIPTRYISLNAAQAGSFKEEQLEKEETENMNGRSARQINVYHNILNIIGDRLRSNPSSNISLSGASSNGPAEGKIFAENIKQYLVTNYGIEESRITTKGRTKPLVPSEQIGASKELTLLRAGDRRVDIVSASPELLLEVGGDMMKPIQISATQTDPLDSYVIFNADGAEEIFKTWSVAVTDNKGMVQNYGPYTRNQESVSGKTILGNNPSGDYKVVMTGITNNGETVKKESAVSLTRQDDLIEKGFRYSILFDFDKTKTIASYENFLKNTVAPLITDGSSVTIHGHTDIVGSEDYNYTLSRNRAMETQRLLNNALKSSGKNNVKFETIGYGENLNNAPFDNNLTEERFYNRTVIIDINPGK
ncbi:MAG: outer membrane beta-barrel protein [Oligoflexus sp.]|nr:outer membrane beta-barrel protein [Pseudopedobacter sp.]